MYIYSGKPTGKGMLPLTCVGQGDDMGCRPVKLKLITASRRFSQSSRWCCMIRVPCRGSPISVGHGRQLCGLKRRDMKRILNFRGRELINSEQFDLDLEQTSFVRSKSRSETFPACYMCGRLRRSSIRVVFYISFWFNSQFILGDNACDCAANVDAAPARFGR